VRIAVGIATVGRPLVLQSLLQELALQTRAADFVIVSAPSTEDFAAPPETVPADFLVGPRGLTRQRNAILERAAGFDAIVFFDDDFLPHPEYLAEIERVLNENPDVAMVTGNVVADGIVGPGLTLEDARHCLSSLSPGAPDLGRNSGFRPVANGYGCNMAVRMAAVEAAACRFDERLPLYGWLEDVDFSVQLARHGGIVRAAAARGVHLGIKQGRQSGVRLGYSQIANPIYLSRKGTCPWRRAIRLMSRNIAANCVRAVRPEPYIDRLGRAFGNARALCDLLAGRLAPERILEL
jgi:Glycosyltransferase like family 2